jgi:hypothetical protein
MTNDYQNSIPVFSDWTYDQFFLAEQVKGQTFEEFAQARHDGAKKIADTAKEKGGNALLTYNHFVVKLPYYKKAAAGKFDLKASQKELASLMKKLDDGTEKMVSLKQIEFQKLVGLIEVVGELIIKFNELN